MAYSFNPFTGKLDLVGTGAVSSVAGRTGAVTLSASDVSGLATVATSGAYADLTGKPSSIDQSLNTTDQVIFQGVGVADGGGGFLDLNSNGDEIVGYAPDINNPSSYAWKIDGSGDLTWFTGYDGSDNPMYSTINGSQLQFTWAPNYNTRTAGISPYGVSVGDGEPTSAGLSSDGVSGLDSNFGGWGLNSSGVGGNTLAGSWACGFGGLSLVNGFDADFNPITVAQIDSATGKVLFDKGAITSNGNGSVSAESVSAESVSAKLFTSINSEIGSTIFIDASGILGDDGEAGGWSVGLVGLEFTTSTSGIPGETTAIISKQTGSLYCDRGAISTDGNGNISATKIITKPMSRNELAALGAVAEGTRAFIKDSVPSTFGTIIAMSGPTGTNKVPCYYDGTNWRVG